MRAMEYFKMRSNKTHGRPWKEIVTESFAVTDMTAVTSAVLFRSESKDSGFNANERS